MSEIPQSSLSEVQLHEEDSLGYPRDAIIAPRIEIPGLVIEHLDPSPESMNTAIEELLEEANRRSKHGGPEDVYHEVDLGNDRSVVFQIRTEGEFENNGSRAVDSIELRFRNVDGSGFEYWLSADSLVLLFDNPDTGEESMDLFNNHKGGEREYEAGLNEDMQEHAASAIAAMRAMMDSATTGHPTTFWRKRR
jgi:hypothetical protein